MKRVLISIMACGLLLAGHASAGENMLSNSGFEDYSCNAMFGCQFTDWSFALGSASANSSDKQEGAVSLQMNPNTATVLEHQEVALTDAYYTVGTTFELKFFYKVVTLPSSSSLTLDCYWEPTPGGDAEAMKAHDAEVLQQVIAVAPTGNWDSLVVQTTKPANSAKLRIRVKVPKNAEVLFDAFSLNEMEGTVPSEPFIRVTPMLLSSVTTTIGNSVSYPVIHIEQGNLEGPTLFELSYTDANQFELSASSLAADESEGDIIITYSPTSAGTHTAYLNIDNLQHPQLHQSIKLTASCTDPSAVPSITVTPSVLPDFEAVAGRQHKQRVRVKSENCTDFVYMRVDHIEGAGFTIDGTMLSKNYESEVEITFSPITAGNYRSTLTIYSMINEFAPVVVALNGIGKEASSETVDWLTDFVWDESAPLALLDEHFDEVSHNETLVLEGWQNVAAADERPWWGFDEAKTTPVRGEGRYAKATAYQYQKDSTGLWEMWLVTPALDYKNAEGKIFAFSVMGEYMPEEDNPASLEVVYIDATDAEHVFFQVFDGISIPQTSDENNIWIPFHINLENQPNMDIFHIGFRFVSPNGTAGGVTYYIDDVSWGRTDLQGINVQWTGNKDQWTKVIENGVLYLMHKGTKYNVQGKRVEN